MPTRRRASPIRLLIADDEPLARRHLAALARERGFTVIAEAASGPEAVSKTQVHCPDVILLDIEMPGFNGIEALHRIASSHPIPSVIVTAHDSPALLKKIADAGAGAWLLKPADAAGLAHAVSIAMARHLDLFAVKDLVRQKELLIREVYHRVSNQMAITASLLELQASQATHQETSKALQVAGSRVRLMAKIHGLLQSSPSQTSILLAPFLTTLAEDLVTGLRPDLHFQKTIRSPDITVTSDTAMNCALLAHELIMNAVRHAFPNGRTGTIRLSLTTLSHSIKLAVEDNGIGLPVNLNVQQSPSLGLKLVNSLTRDMAGILRTSTGSSRTAFILTFPAETKRNSHGQTN